MKLLLCLLPAFIQAEIQIDIFASRFANQTTVTTSGSSKNIITKEDARIFNITNAVIKYAVANLTGQIPTDVFLKDPTPWNDLYKTYKWEPVEIIVKPIKGRVLGIDTENVIVAQKAVNKKNETITGTVENKVDILAKYDEAFSAEITHNIDYLGLGDDTKFKLKSAWGKDVRERKISTFGATSIEVIQKPKTNVSVALTATKVTVEVEIEYAAMLNGHVATNNEVQLQGHHFWAYDIGSVMAAAGISDSVRAFEVVIIEFYTDANYTLLEN